MSLKKELGKRLLVDMIRAAKGQDPALVLVVDPHTSKILSSCLRMYDIMEAGVLVLQNLLMEREKLPDLPAIYFIEPTIDGIERLIADFPKDCVSGPAAATAKYAQKARYLNAHLYFTSHVPQAGMNLLKASPIMKKVKSFVEMNVDFLAFESRVFLLDQPASIPRLYFPTDNTKLSAALSEISAPLVSLCITLQEYPHVRFSAVGRSGICKGLASFFDSDMKKTVSQLSSWKMNEARERGTLLIVDRSMDPLTPLMHEFTFQAMVNDLLPVSGEIATLPVSLQGSNGLPKPASELEADQAAAELVLSEDDHLWHDFRHAHIAVVMRDLTAKFKEFKGLNKMAGLQQNDKASTKDMIQAMKDMPEYKNMMKKYHKHMSLAQECMARFDTQQLKPIGELEQDLATSLDSEGDSIAMKKVKDQLMQFCSDARVAVLDKMRLVMAYMVAQGGMQDTTRRELCKTVDADLQDAIRNLDALGVDLTTGGDKKKKALSKDRLDEFKALNKSCLKSSIGLQRYTPVLRGVMDQLVTGVLKEELFPYTSPPPPGSAGTAAAASASASAPPAARKGVSARKKPAGGASWKDSESAPASSPVAAAAQPNEAEDLRPRFIVFVLGGVTFSEMRSCYEVAEARGVNLYIGSTGTLTPTDYLRDLSNLTAADFAHAVAASSTSPQDRAVAASSSGISAFSVQAPPSSSAAASSSAAPARRGPIVDSDSDDDAPVNIHKLNVRV